MPRKMELLAPAGSWDALVAAVQNGADAVYLGGTAFSARQSAANFGPEEMIKALDYAHVRGVKIFVTANTLVKDSELQEALEFLRFLYENGVDWVILQDLGLARLARLVLPDLRLHASTQMTVHNLKAVKLLENEGFARIVLARELSLANIKTIVKGTEAEIEIFVHGALCISYSGQCLMSSLIGGRSGNRGRCAQPCRLGYELLDERGQRLIDAEKTGKHLLSPRDLNMIRHIPDLARTGVDSLKVEGRMKRPEYVATVIRTYREALDRYYEDPENYSVTPQEEKDLLQIFNRGFTTGYFYNNPGPEMMSYKRPNNRGLKLGRVESYDYRKGTALLTLEETLRTGDGVEIWVTRGGRKGVIVHQLRRGGLQVEETLAGEQVEIQVPSPVKKGDRIFKTHDRELISRAQQTYTSPRELRKIPVAFKIRVEMGKPIKLTMADGINQVEVVGSFLAEPAQKKALNRETLAEQLGRLGNDPYYLQNIEAKIDDNVMVPLGEINNVRRQAVEFLSFKRAKVHRRKIDEINWVSILQELLTEPIKHRGFKKEKPLLVASVSTMENVEAAARAGADIIAFGGENFKSNRNYTQDEIKKCIEVCRQNQCLFYLSTPRILQDDEQNGFDRLWEIAFEGVTDGALVTNLGFLYLGKDFAGKTKIAADYSLNIFNSSSIRWFEEKGINHVTLSPELNLEETKDLARLAVLPVEVIIHGTLPLMVSEHCVVGSLAGNVLRDRMGFDFPVRTDQNGHSHIFNAKTMDVWEEIPELIEAGVSLLRLELKINAPSYVSEIVAVYRKRLDDIIEGKCFPKAPAVLEKLNPGGLTKGHFFRGV